MSEQDGTQTSSPHRPTNDNKKAWKAYWKTLDQPWRTEPEIDEERQKYLAERRKITPDIEKGIYPFKDIKLSRADVEWLLATHENGRGPIDWSDESQRDRDGLDLRGADLSGNENQLVNLARLPLSRLIGGLLWGDWSTTTEDQQICARIQLRGASLSGAQLQGANLFHAQLQKANLFHAQLQKAILSGAQLQGAILSGAQLQGANLGEAQLQGADLSGAQLQGADLLHAQLQGANLHLAQLERAILSGAQLQGAHLSLAQLQGAHLSGAQLQEASLIRAQLQGADLSDILLADKHHIGPTLVDVQWSECNLAVVDWSQMFLLGDEQQARKKKHGHGPFETRKEKGARLREYKTAVRANRQLAVALQSQGLNEDAARFVYRAQVLQKAVFWFQMVQNGISLSQRIRALLSWLFSWFMFLVAGYGYRFGRSFLTYAAVISVFATAYYLLGLNDIGPHHVLGPHYLSWYEAFVVSMTAFHGRGFFVGTFSPGDPQALVAAIEAFLGLLIEVTFIATLTQRLFGR